MIPRYGEWAKRLGGRGLSIIGVHTPETDEERDGRKLARFIREHAIDWPVIVDADYAIWDRFRIDAWPTIVLIDRAGVVRAVHVGDDRAAAIERDLERLLDERAY